jgi:hypothetical protein
MEQIICLSGWFICGFFGVFLWHYNQYKKSKENKQEYYVTFGEAIGAIIAIPFGLISLVLICIATDIFDTKIFRIKTGS